LDVILKYFPELTPLQQSQLERLNSLYREWNEKINVVSRKDIDQLYERHLLHSLGIAKIMRFKPGTKVLDVGTGGGLPGIPLAILFPDSQFHLIDSIGKKIMVVKEITAALDLKNLSSEQIRAEQVQDKYDFVVSRAVTNIVPFFDWVKNKFLKGGHNDLKNGILYLKGGDLKEELQGLKRPYRMYDLKDHFEEEFFETKKVVFIPVP
jgi:16S rRNA (guanine527-N7)-methyltransferase